MGITPVDVSIILPVYNAAEWLDECLGSIKRQQDLGEGMTVELSIFNDSSKDDSLDILKSWKDMLISFGIHVILSGHSNAEPKGVGYAKNQAVRQSSGRFLCFQDADDIMDPMRIKLQYQAALKHQNTIIGCKVTRIPKDSTIRYTRWCNGMTQKQLLTQVFTSHGPTVLMPTWFCSRQVYDKVGGFDERGKGIPEDLLFFHKFLGLGGAVCRIDEYLLTYRYHPECTTHSVHRDTIWDIRITAIQKNIINQWKHFTIWNAGKEGRRFYRSLSTGNRSKVKAFCDVDAKKIGKVYTYEECKESPKPKVPILHFSEASPPFIICVKLDLTGGGLERNIESLNLVEGEDYFYFS
ncbi:queuosine-tRNA galactosyltransferase-like [Antedon mediterranea]|uniref:queuosine-tRNA galactosyltransferase-like n=1 Tax=Antedon mediterranea TaxID=105859 RepID=UPI003AF6F3C9